MLDKTFIITMREIMGKDINMSPEKEIAWMDYLQAWENWVDCCNEGTKYDNVNWFVDNVLLLPLFPRTLYYQFKSTMLMRIMDKKKKRIDKHAWK